MPIQRKTTPTRTTADRNIGTLWTLVRGESVARCVLIKVSDGLELRVLLDESRLRGEPCGSYSEAFELGDRWRERMMLRGWKPLPSRAIHAS